MPAKAIDQARHPNEVTMIALVALNSRAADPLQTLIRLNLESEKCFRIAADRVDDAELTALYYAYARQRAAFAEELRDQRNQQPIHEPSGESAARAMSAVHRWWHGLRQRLVTDAATLSLRLATRAEEEMRQAYDQVLREPRDAPWVPVLERQRQAVTEAEERLRALQASREMRQAG